MPVIRNEPSAIPLLGALAPALAPQGLRYWDLSAGSQQPERTETLCNCACSGISFTAAARRLTMLLTFPDSLYQISSLISRFIVSNRELCRGPVPE